MIISFSLLGAVIGILAAFAVNYPEAIASLVNLAWHPDDPRRAENLAALEYVSLWKRPAYVAALLAPALREGLPGNLRLRKEKREKANEQIRHEGSVELGGEGGLALNGNTIPADLIDELSLAARPMDVELNGLDFKLTGDPVAVKGDRPIYILDGFEVGAPEAEKIQAPTATHTSRG